MTMARRESIEKYDTPPETPSGDITVADPNDKRLVNNNSHGHYARARSKDDTITQVLEVNGLARHQSHQSRGMSIPASLTGARRKSLHPTAGMSDAEKVEFISDIIEDGERKFHKLTWFQLVIVLTVSAVALGTLSMPVVFAMLGMTGGVILTVGMGVIAVYTSYVVGQVKLKYPQVVHYSDIGHLLLPGRGGVILTKVLQVIFVVFLTLGIGSHCLTGQIAFTTIIGDNGLCKVVYSIVTMILLIVCALPPSFAEMSWLGYIDFLSIMSAVFVTLVATGIQANKNGWETGWSATAPKLTFVHGMLAACNVLFAYAFCISQFSFMEEMAKPEEFPKSVLSLGAIMITIYTLVGALGYAFIGPDVEGPALLSAGPTVARVAFGLALPVIFISGSILVVVTGRFIMDHAFRNSTVRYVNTTRGWMVWIGLVIGINVAAWVIAQAIPVFSPLLGITAALFNSGFSLYLPGIMWFMLIREGGCFSSAKNIFLTFVNALIIVLGLLALGGGTYASIADMVDSYRKTGVGKPFAC